ncbi:MAG TPA: hypothetical protein VKP69_05900, partial [Isosphaeraceae bacterium]|nr:hypothetical protein [Isosphaeraceae bacterium]
LDPVHALFHVDAHTNDTLATAEDLDPIGVYGSEAPDRVTASLSDPTDVDFYHIETPQEAPVGGAPTAPLVMTVTVRATEVNGIMPAASVFDAQGHLLPALVLAHGDGTETIQVTDDQPDSDYYIRVGADPTSGQVVGNYDLDVEYGHVAADPTTFLAGAMDGPAVQDSFTLVVNQAQLFDFLLAAEAAAAPRGAAVRMTLTDARGAVVATRSAPAGATAGGDPVLLAPGVYQALFTIESPGGGPPPPMTFRLYGAGLTDPIGPALDDPTLRPVADPASGGRSATSLPILGSAGAPYYWLALGLNGRDAAEPGSAPNVTGALARAGDGKTQDLSVAALVGLGSQAGPPLRGDAAHGTATAPTAPGASTLPARPVATPVITPAPPIASLTSLGSALRNDPDGPKGEPRGEQRSVPGGETLPAAPEVQPAAWGGAGVPPAPPSLALDRPPLGQAPSPKGPGAPADSPARSRGPDVAHTIVFLGIAALLYGQTLARRGGHRAGRPVRLGRVPSVMRSGMNRLCVLCRR